MLIKVVMFDFLIINVPFIGVVDLLCNRALDFCLKLIRSQYLKTEKLHMTKETNWHFSFLNRLSNKVAQS